MERIAIGKSGLTTSRIGLGTWAIGGWMWGGTALPAFIGLNEDLLPMVRSRTAMIPKLREFRRSVRIIFGAADPYLNQGVARSFHEFLPESELFLIPSARHFVQMDEPEQVARLILTMPSQGSKQS